MPVKKVVKKTVKKTAVVGKSTPIPEVVEAILGKGLYHVDINVGKNIVSFVSVKANSKEDAEKIVKEMVKYVVHKETHQHLTIK